MGADYHLASPPALLMQFFLSGSLFCCACGKSGFVLFFLPVRYCCRARHNPLVAGVFCSCAWASTGIGTVDSVPGVFNVVLRHSDALDGGYVSSMP